MWSEYFKILLCKCCQQTPSAVAQCVAQPTRSSEKCTVAERRANLTNVFTCVGLWQCAKLNWSVLWGDSCVLLSNSVVQLQDGFRFLKEWHHSPKVHPPVNVCFSVQTEHTRTERPEWSFLFVESTDGWLMASEGVKQLNVNNQNQKTRKKQM